MKHLKIDTNLSPLCAHLYRLLTMRRDTKKCRLTSINLSGATAAQMDGGDWRTIIVFSSRPVQYLVKSCPFSTQSPLMHHCNFVVAITLFKN